MYYLPKVTWPGADGKEASSYLAGFERGSNRTLNQFVKLVQKKSSIN
jgi:hypothetical protein